MGKVTGIVKRVWKRACNREIVLYLVFGVLTTVISNVVFNICLRQDFGTVWAHTVSFIAAVAFAYPMNKVFVFGSKEWGTGVVVTEAARFVGARLFSFFFEMGALLLLIDYLRIPGYIAKLVTSVVVVILNYVFSRLIFRKR